MAVVLDSMDVVPHDKSEVEVVSGFIMDVVFAEVLLLVDVFSSSVVTPEALLVVNESPAVVSTCAVVFVEVMLVESWEVEVGSTSDVVEIQRLFCIADVEVNQLMVVVEDVDVNADVDVVVVVVVLLVIGNNVSYWQT